MTTDKRCAQLLSERGYRVTRPREAILALLRSVDCHPDANWVYGQVRQELPHISLGTVYRTLGMLAEAGLIQELHCSDETQARYDGDTQGHYHILCRACADVRDVHLDSTRDSESAVARLTGYQVEGHSLSFFGLCPECQQDR